MKKEQQLDWICRVLMTADIFVILSGYFSFFQTERKLVSPLIPRSTVYEVFSDGADVLFRISILAALIFIAGLWLYSFKKKIAAIVVFAAVVFLFFAKDLFIKIQVLHVPPLIHYSYAAPPPSSLPPSLFHIP
jgi:hypothetical protein